ncbi:two-component regulator propeller domain-containing protein [Lewinella sp. 4G2]|uniref:two-component regulator propeller domain-containing protein n=1 Tax=Lewinella sp. 4G2 TaxID=1803372 RepID=UPI0007B4681F|nr:two-component regulator propeller domain-containing protein [Lewinella sp. 4G2]OAV45961.1 hypothetical protein A3850_018865 [Lewinella sp. 4G2]
MRFLIFIVSLLLLAAPVDGQPYGFLTWSVEDGLPQSQVTALAEDQRGYLWVGTNGGGVARFDGASFKTFGVADGLADNFIRGLAVDEAGVIYALTRRGFATWHPDSSSFSLQEVVDENGKLFGADAGAVRWGQLQDNPRKKALEFSTIDAVYALEPANDGWRVVPGDQLFQQDGPDLPLANGNVLVGTRTQGLFLNNQRGEPIAHYTEEAGDLPHNHVLSLLQDRQKRVWIGTSGGGLVRMIPTGLRYFDTGDGLAGNRVYALHAGGGGRLWIGTSQKGIQYLEDGEFQRLPGEDPTYGAKITSITEDGGGRIYLATDGRGITVLDSNRVRQLRRRSGLASEYNLKLLPDGDSSVLAVSYSEGVNRLEYFPARDSFAVSTAAADGLVEGLAPLSLASAIAGPKNTLLLGTTRGEIHQRSVAGLFTPRVFGQDNGLPPGKVSALALRLGSQLWVSIQGYGLYYTDLRVNDPQFFPLPASFQGVSTNIFQLVVDPNQSALWLGTERGLTRIFLNADGQPDYYREYGRAEGFLGGETTRDAVTVDSLGRLWFGTLNGLVRYEEDRGDTYLAPPPVNLERVNLFYAPVQASDYETRGGVPVFPSSSNHFQFRFAAVDLTYPDRLRYRFRLRGEEAEWSPLTDERAVRYAGLSPGRYTFLVEATTDGGKTFGEADSYAFVIDTPLFRSGWFLALATLLLIGLIVGVAYGIYQRVQRKEAALRAELETQNTLLSLEQKARQLQMNPHFIFNALNGIRGLVDGQHDAEARAQITKFATLMRGILNNSRQDMITLEEEVDVLREYIEMERFCQNFPIDYRIQIAEELDPEEVSLPPMLLQPFVENAILHGLAGKENGGTITISFSLRGRRMRCLVEDDGVGRKAAAAKKVNRAANHKSVAVEVTGERLRAAGGSLAISDREGGGTVVEVVTPVETW